MLKLHLGCGRNKLPGWENHDRDVDIRKPLPWSDGVADFIYAEHVIEHVTTPEALFFLTEARRVLRPMGALRVAFPDATKIAELAHDALDVYATMLERKGINRRATRAECVRSVFDSWGHVSAWTYDLAWAAVLAAGFAGAYECAYGDSAFHELTNIERRHADTGEAAKLETTIVEAVRD